MNLTVSGIQRIDNDEQLFNLLSTALQELFPPELQGNRDEFLAALALAPRGLRAMAAIYDLDVSILRRMWNAWPDEVLVDLRSKIS